MLGLGWITVKGKKPMYALVPGLCEPFRRVSGVKLPPRKYEPRVGIPRLAWLLLSPDQPV